MFILKKSVKALKQISELKRCFNSIAKLQILFYMTMRNNNFNFLFLIH